MVNEAERTAEIYRQHRGLHKPGRNDIVQNPEVLFQDLAGRAALIRTLRFINFHAGLSVLDVGCGSGGSLLPFLEIGCSLKDLMGIEVQAEMIDALRERFPQLPHRVGSAAAIPFEDQSFDIAYACHIFMQVQDLDVEKAIAREMKRAARRWIIVRDWNVARRGDRPITPKYLQEVFGLPIVHTEKGAIMPPLGRRLSKYAPWAYFAIASIFPFGSRVYVMRA